MPIFSYTIFQLLGDRHQDPYQGSAHGPRWGEGGTIQDPLSEPPLLGTELCTVCKTFNTHTLTYVTRDSGLTYIHCCVS